jgi:hypothetical protein
MFIVLIRLHADGAASLRPFFVVLRPEVDSAPGSEGGGGWIEIRLHADDAASSSPFLSPRPSSRLVAFEVAVIARRGDAGNQGFSCLDLRRREGLGRRIRAVQLAAHGGRGVACGRGWEAREPGGAG